MLAGCCAQCLQDAVRNAYRRHGEIRLTECKKDGNWTEGMIDPGRGMG
jgi:hypothetical protein